MCVPWVGLLVPERILRLDRDAHPTGDFFLEHSSSSMHRSLCYKLYIKKSQTLLKVLARNTQRKKKSQDPKPMSEALKLHFSNLELEVVLGNLARLWGRGVYIVLLRQCS